METNPGISMEGRSWLLGKVSGLIDEILPAKTIIDDMVSMAAERLQVANGCVVSKARL